LPRLCRAPAVLFLIAVPDKPGTPPKDETAPKRSRATRGKPVEISPSVFIMLKKLAELRIYGDRPGPVANFIIRKEVMRLWETGKLNEAELLKAFQAESAKVDDGGDESESLES
jgi:hypothetical protein